MNLSSAALRLMAEKGLTLEDVAEIVAANEKSDPTAVERQRRCRAKKANGHTVTVTRDKVSNDRDNLTFPEVKNSELKSSSQKFALPDDIPAEPWAGWEEMRKRIRKVPTNHARSLAVAELRRLRDEEGWPPGEVLNHCTMNSYQGIFPPRRSQHDRSDSLTAGALSDISAQLARN